MSFKLIQDISKKSNNQNTLIQNKTGYVKHDYIDSLFDISLFNKNSIVETKEEPIYITPKKLAFKVLKDDGFFIERLWLEHPEKKGVIEKILKISIAWNILKKINSDNLQTEISNVSNKLAIKENKISIPVINTSKSDKFLKIADGLQNQIDRLKNPPISHQNPTRRRANIASNMWERGDKLEGIQTILRNLSKEILSNSNNSIIEKINSKSDLETILSDYNSYKYQLKYNPNYRPNYNKIKLSKSSINSFDELLKIGEYLESLKETRIVNLNEKKIKNIELNLIGSKIPGFFPTPKPVIDLMIEYAELNNNDLIVLEPSAGKGDIAEAIRSQGIEPDVLEINYTLQDLLKLKNFNIIGNDFLNFSEKNYDRIIMNPPFENLQDIDHVKHAYNLLKNNGVIVSIMSTTPFFRNDRKAVEFRTWLDSIFSEVIELPEKSFTGKDSFRQTGVNTKLIVLKK